MKNKDKFTESDDEIKHLFDEEDDIEFDVDTDGDWDQE